MSAAQQRILCWSPSLPVYGCHPGHPSRLVAWKAEKLHLSLLRIPIGTTRHTAADRHFGALCQPRPRHASTRRQVETIYTTTLYTVVMTTTGLELRLHSLHYYTIYCCHDNHWAGVEAPHSLHYYTIYCCHDNHWAGVEAPQLALLHYILLS